MRRPPSVPSAANFLIFLLPMLFVLGIFFWVFLRHERRQSEIVTHMAREREQSERVEQLLTSIREALIQPRITAAQRCCWVIISSMRSHKRNASVQVMCSAGRVSEDG
jgi:hypothetical protein